MFLSRIEANARRRRYQRFCQLIPPKRPVRILDVGGTRAYWSTVGLGQLGECEIVLYNIAAAEDPGPPFVIEHGNACDLSRFADRSFDVAFSNSVIEFVGDADDQRRMICEMRRVASIVVLQTPNASFPVDWQTLVPFFHWLPPRWRAWCHRRFRVGRVKRVPDGATADYVARRVRALTRADIESLFPGCTIECERVMGLVKSIVAHNAATAWNTD